MLIVLPRLMLFTALLGIVLLWLAFRFDPMRKHARVLRHGLVGLAMLLVWNALPLPHLGVNPLSAVFTGALGLPGLGVMAVLALLD